MTYATQQNMITRFGETELRQLTDRTKTGAIDAAVLAQALVDADAQINAYLAPVYALPLATVPTILERIACDLARYQLWDVRAGEVVTARYNEALAFLKNVAKGTASLGLDPSNQTQTPTGGVLGKSAAPVFSKHQLADY